MSWIPQGPCLTVDELVRWGLTIEEACWIAWDSAPVPSTLKEESE